MFALNQDGKFLYISETVSIYLGLSQVRVPPGLTGALSLPWLCHPSMKNRLGWKGPTQPPSTVHVQGQFASEGLTRSPLVFP